MSTTHSLPLSHDEGRFTEERKTPALDTVKITRHFMRYVQTFQALNPQAMLRHVHVPLVFLDGREMHVLSSSAEVEGLLTNLMRDLASRGYARSDIEELWVYPLSPSTALVSVARARYNASDEEIDCLGETYTLLRDGDDEWRIGIAIMHDAANVLRVRQRWRRD